MPLTQSTYEIPFFMNWEPDLFGNVRRNMEASNANLQSTAADMYNVNLVLTSELAADYFSLRELDAETQVVQESVDIQQKACNWWSTAITAESLPDWIWRNSKPCWTPRVTQLYLVKQQREQFEHAIAVLTGNPAATFSVPVRPLNAVACSGSAGRAFRSAGAPSRHRHRRTPDGVRERVGRSCHGRFLSAADSLRQRRIPEHQHHEPDHRAERDLVARRRSAAAGSQRWTQPRQSCLRQASYDETVANYRESVLVAFQQVEDGLSGLNELSQAASTQNAAVADARRALEIANNRYVGGVTTYLDVITAQSTLLTNQRLSTQLLGQQMVTEVALVKALGGGWDASQIQNEQVHPKAIQAIQQ